MSRRRSVIGASLRRGRPPIPIDMNRVRDLMRDGMSVRYVAAALGVTHGTAQRAMENVKATVTPSCQ